MKVCNTKTSGVSNATKVLIYGEAGSGKTTQAVHYAAAFGKGLVLSMESGLSSVADAGLDFVPITSWDGTHAPDEGVYSFKGVCRYVGSPQFKADGYTWIMADSLTELSDLCWAPIEEHHRAKAPANKGPDGFAIWNDYGAAFIGAAKWLRDRDCHVVMTCLAKGKDDDNGEALTLPHVRGNAIGAQLVGLYDFVFGLVRVTKPAEQGQEPVEQRFIVTGGYKGWQCKARDQHRRLKLVERSDNVPELIRRVQLSPAEWAKEQAA